MSINRSEDADFAAVYWRETPAADVDPGPFSATALGQTELRLLADNLPSLCWIADRDGYIGWYNRRWHDYCGSSAAGMEGWGWQSVHDPKILPDVMTRWTACIAAGQAFEMTFPIKGADGTLRPFLTRVTPLKDRAGRVLRWFGNNTDVSPLGAAETALAQSEAYVRLLLNSSAEAFYAVDRHGVTTLCNATFLTMMGFAREQDAVGRKLHDVIHHTRPGGARYDVAECPIYRCASHGTPAHVVDEMFYKLDGTPIPVEYWAKPIVVDGEHRGAICTFLDITDRRVAEARLIASEAEFRAFAQAMPNQVWAARPDGLLDWFNDRVYDYGGRGPGELDGNGWAIMVHPDDAPLAVERWGAALASGATYETEFRLRRGDGNFRWHIARALPIRDPSGKITRWIGTNTDIEDQRTARAALATMNETLERQVAERTAERDRMWETSPDLMLVMDFDGVVRRVNPAWTTQLGYHAEELVGHHVDEFVLADDHTGTLATYETVTGAGTPKVENRYRHKDGSIRWISWVAAPAQGMRYATGRDITVEKQRADELARTQEALRQSQKMEAVGQLTGGIAHDFNNLLTGIVGSLELLQVRIAQGRTNDVDRYVIAAQGAAKRAAALTHRLLAFSRRQTLDPKPTDVNRLVMGMGELIRRTIGPEIAMEPLVAANGLWTTLVDPSQLENALLNLSINARDAMPHGGKLTIETGNKWLDDYAAKERELAPGPYVALSVSDNGTGMPADVVARAFDPFFTTKPIGMGTGLGLSMIYGFAKQSGGQVRIYSEVGHGTMVCLYLPRYVGEGERAEPLPEFASAPRADHDETVLLVDDEPTVRMLIADVLGDLGYTTIEAADGMAGLKVLQSNARIDLLVTDVGLPGGLNGRQVADAARVLRPSLKVLFITGYAENAVLSHGHLDPGMHVLTKPFAIDALANRIKGLITGSRDWPLAAPELGR